MGGAATDQPCRRKGKFCVSWLGMRDPTDGRRCCVLLPHTLISGFLPMPPCAAWLPTSCVLQETISVRAKEMRLCGWHYACILENLYLGEEHVSMPTDAICWCWQNMRTSVMSHKIVENGWIWIIKLLDHYQGKFTYISNKIPDWKSFGETG